MVDLSVTHSNKFLPSVVDTNKGSLEDRPRLSLEGLIAYAYPPLPLLDQFSVQDGTERYKVILIVPRWPQSPW